jgi:hypothetical protein
MPDSRYTHQHRNYATRLLDAAHGRTDGIFLTMQNLSHCLSHPSQAPHPEDRIFFYQAGFWEIIPPGLANPTSALI